MLSYLCVYVVCVLILDLNYTILDLNYTGTYDVLSQIFQHLSGNYAYIIYILLIKC